MTENHTARRLRPLVLVVALLLATFVVQLGHVALAAETIDLSARGSITIRLRDTSGTVLSGGEVEIYQVATIQRDGSGYKYVYVNGFGADVETLPNSEIDKTDLNFINGLVEHANQTEPTQSQNISADGVVTFRDLPVGVYLVVQSRLSSGNRGFNPFIVTIPNREDGKLVYDVKNVAPKVGPINPNKPDNPDQPDKPHNNGNQNTNNGNGNGNQNTNNGNGNGNNNGNGNGNQNGNGNGNTNGNGNNNGNGNTNNGGNTPGTPGGGTSGGGGSTGGSGGSSSASPRLPQTGQLWWPVWTLLVAGGSLIVAGLVVRDRHHMHPAGQE